MATSVYLDRINKKANKKADRTDKTLKIIGVAESLSGLAGATANGLGPDLVRTGVSGGLMVSGILTYIGSSSIAGKRLVRAKRKGLETVQHALKEINNEEVENLKNNITYFGYK